MPSFRVVFLDGTSGPIEGSVVRYTGDDGTVEDISIPYLMNTLATVEDIRDAMRVTIQYPPTSKDPEYTIALQDLDAAMLALIGNVSLPPVVQEEPIGSTELTVSIKAPPEPEFWN